MANGDDAAAVGYDTVAGSEDIRQAYDEINVSRDYLARHRTSGTHRADQITSGVFPVKRGGTGRSNLFAATTGEEANPTGLRILVVNAENDVYAMGTTSDIDGAYLGFRLHVQNLNSLNFGSDGDLSVAHGAPFTPIGIWPVARLDHDSGSVIVVPRATLPSWNSENVFLRAKNTATGLPYDGPLSRLDLFCFGVA